MQPRDGASGPLCSHLCPECFAKGFHYLLHKYYQLGDLFVSASTSETQGLTYLEAAANGLPLLCRRDPCLDGVILEGQNGYEYEAEEEFCEIIDTILGHPEWCRAAGSQSEQIAAVYDKSHFAEQIEDVYEMVTL